MHVNVPLFLVVLAHLQQQYSNSAEALDTSLHSTGQNSNYGTPSYHFGNLPSLATRIWVCACLSTRVKVRERESAYLMETGLQPSPMALPGAWGRLWISGFGMKGLVNYSSVAKRKLLHLQWEHGSEKQQVVLSPATDPELACPCAPE